MSKSRAWFNPKIAIAIGVLALAIGYLMYTSVQSTSASYFVSVSELAAESQSVDGELVRVGGPVVEESINFDGVGGAVDFEITDGDEVLQIHYDGQVPDIFDEHIEAVVEGTYHSDGVFQADTVMTKCPSRFEEEDGDKEEYEEYHGDDEYYESSSDD